MRIIGTDYFKTMGIPVRQGRVFNDNDRFESRAGRDRERTFRAQIFSRAKMSSGNEFSPVSARTKRDAKMREIIGVVGNVKHLSLRKEDSPEMYLPRTQIPFDIMSLAIRTSVANPAGLTTAMRNELAAMDPSIPLTQRARFRRIHLAFAGAAALQRAPALHFRRDRAAADRDRNLWRDGLFRRATDE